MLFGSLREIMMQKHAVSYTQNNSLGLSSGCIFQRTATFSSLGSSRGHSTDTCPARGHRGIPAGDLASTVPHRMHLGRMLGISTRYKYFLNIETFKIHLKLQTVFLINFQKRLDIYILSFLLPSFPCFYTHACTIKIYFRTFQR